MRIATASNPDIRNRLDKAVEYLTAVMEEPLERDEVSQLAVQNLILRCIGLPPGRQASVQLELLHRNDNLPPRSKAF